MIIAFCGMDGSGKTTLSRRVKEELVKKGHSAVVIEPFEYVIWAPLLKLLGGGERLVSAGGEKKNNFFLFKLWPFLALFDHWAQFLFKIKTLEKKYDYIIADRFFFDFAASFKYFGYTTKWLDKLYLKLIPKTDLTFVLDLPPEIALEREQDGSHSLNFFSYQRAYYLALIEDFRLHKLNALLETEELVKATNTSVRPTAGEHQYSL